MFDGLTRGFYFLHRDYKMPDGKPANKFGYDNQPQNRELAEGVIKETHGHYQRLVSGKYPNSHGLFVPENLN